MNEELENKYKNFIRLFISYNDFKQSRETAQLILDEKCFEKRKELRGHEGQKIRKLWEALNCTMIVAYCRPFSGNDKKTKLRIPDLPGNVLKCLSEKEKELHKILIEERNTILAHSDSEFWDIRIQYLEIEGNENKLFLPIHNNTRAPLLPEPTGMIIEMCDKLMDEVFKRRMAIERELRKEIKSSFISKAEIEDIKRQYGA